MQNGDKLLNDQEMESNFFLKSADLSIERSKEGLDGVDWVSSRSLSEDGDQFGPVLEGVIGLAFARSA